MKYILFILSVAVIPFSCNNPSNQADNSQETDTIPKGAVQFEYDEKMLKMITLKGTLNDSIDLNVIFDTGWTSITVSDSMKPNNIKDSYIKELTKIKIDDWEYRYNAIEYLPKDHPLIQTLGSRSGIIDWKIFENKIIKISYKHKYLRELKDKKELEGYDSVKINRENVRLVIPINISYKDKKIKELAIIDTGSNSYIVFNKKIVSKYKINTDEADHIGSSTMATGRIKGFSVIVDTIMVGNSYIVGGRAAFGNHTIKYALLGNKFLENFDVVLDLRDYYLYLKPIN